MNFALPTILPAFLRHVARRRRAMPATMESIPDYVARRAALLTPEHLDALRAELPELRAGLTAIRAPGFPHLPAQLELLSAFLCDALDGTSPSCEAARNETAFALHYFANEDDFIPDEVPEIGYADDSAVVRAVLTRHRDLFREYCRSRRLPWSRVTLAP